MLKAIRRYLLRHSIFIYTNELVSIHKKNIYIYIYISIATHMCIVNQLPGNGLSKKKIIKRN